MGKIIKNGVNYSSSSVTDVLMLTNAEYLADKERYDNLPNLICITDAGTSIPNEAANVQYEDEESSLGATNVQDAIEKLSARFTDCLTAEIPAGETSVTLTDERIKTTSFIDVYFWDKVMSYTSLTTTDGHIVMEIPAQETDTQIAVRVI